MKSLAHLPGDILAQCLLGADFSSLLLPLWKCGSHQLNKKLAHSITEIHLCDEIEFSTSRWPRCLSSLTKLRKLSIFLAKGYLMPSATALQQELLALSPTLEELRIYSLDEIWAETDQSTSAAAPLPAPTDATILNASNARFPSLRTLYTGVHCKKIVRSFFFRSFCAPLRTLGTNSAHYHRDSGTRHSPTDDLADIKHILPHLTTLDVDLWVDSLINATQEADASRFFESLPSSLTELPRARFISNLNGLDSLPRGIASIDDLISIESPSWNHHFAQRCPPKIRRMHLRAIDYASFILANTHWASQLPRQISSFILDSPIDLHDLSFLPCSITSLDAPISCSLEECDAAVADFESNGSPLLPNLTRWTSPTPIKPWCLKLFPNLLELSATFSLDDGEKIEYWPPRLQSFHSFLIGSHTLPDTITSIVLSWPQEQVILQEHFASLPSSITHLDLAVGYVKYFLSILDLITFPQGVRVLKLPKWSGHFDRLPRSLELLNIGVICDHPNTEPIDFFAGLPSSLTSFTVRVHAYSLKLSGRSLAHLVNLEILDMTRRLEFLPDVMMALGNLTRLRRCVINVLDFTSEHARFIPQQLHMLYLGPFTDAQAENWPMPCFEMYIHDENPIFLSRLEKARQDALKYPDPRSIIDLPAQP